MSSAPPQPPSHSRLAATRPTGSNTLQTSEYRPRRTREDLEDEDDACPGPTVARRAAGTFNMAAMSITPNCPVNGAMELISAEIRRNFSITPGKTPIAKKRTVGS